MIRVIIRRLLWFIPVFFVVTGLTFATMHALPGGPFDSDKTPPALIQQMEEVFGLNRPVQEQYFIWLSSVAQLKFGPSLAARGKPVESFLLPGLAVSVQLGLFAMLFALSVGMPAGIVAAMHRGSWRDRSATLIAIIGVSVPAIVLGPVLQWLFALRLGWFPVAQWTSLSDGLIPYLSHIVLPAITLGAG
ncbi:MAG: ABC transporter permease, partial [Caldilinea sp.]|nr:ABC transporter permease [Caldilinea sp.]